MARELVAGAADLEPGLADGFEAGLAARAEAKADAGFFAALGACLARPEKLIRLAALPETGSRPESFAAGRELALAAGFAALPLTEAPLPFLCPLAGLTAGL